MAHVAKNAEEKPAFAFLNVMDDKAIDKAITNVVKYYSNAKAREDLHVVLVACVEHAVKHNGGDKLTNLWQRLPNNAPHGALAAWIHKFTNLRYAKDKVGGKRWMGRDESGKTARIHFMIAEGKQYPFYAMPEADQNKERPPFDPWAYIEHAVARLENEAKKKNSKLDPVQRGFATGLGAVIVNFRKEVESRVAKSKTPDKVAPEAGNVEEADFEAAAELKQNQQIDNEGKKQARA